MAINPAHHHIKKPCGIILEERLVNVVLEEGTASTLRRQKCINSIKTESSSEAVLDTGGQLDCAQGKLQLP